MTETLLETLRFSCYCIGATGAAMEDYMKDKDAVIETESSLTVTSSALSTISTSLSIGNNKTDIEKEYENVEAITYIESCSNEEVNDMLNQINELLDENSNNKANIKTLGRKP